MNQLDFRLRTAEVRRGLLGTIVTIVKARESGQIRKVCEATDFGGERIRAMRRTACGILAVAVLATLETGCETVRPALRPDPGVTGYANIGPYSVQRFFFAPNLVERAAVEAMTDMKMNSVKRTAKDDGVSLKGFLYDGRYICLTLEPEGPNTIVSINIDVYGDESMAQILLDRMGVRLATLPQVVNPPFDPRAMSDSVLHRGKSVEGYRGATLR
jgi:hypothetical protein